MAGEWKMKRKILACILAVGGVILCAAGQYPGAAISSGGSATPYQITQRYPGYAPSLIDDEFTTTVINTGALAAWTQGTGYSFGQFVSSNGNAYQCVSASACTAGATAPSGTGAQQSDGACSWTYMAATTTASTLNGWWVFSAYTLANAVFPDGAGNVFSQNANPYQFNWFSQAAFSATTNIINFWAGTASVNQDGGTAWDVDSITRPGWDRFQVFSDSSSNTYQVMLVKALPSGYFPKTSHWTATMHWTLSGYSSANNANYDTGIVLLDSPLTGGAGNWFYEWHNAFHVSNWGSAMAASYWDGGSGNPYFSSTGVAINASSNYSVQVAEYLQMFAQTNGGATGAIQPLVLGPMGQPSNVDISPYSTTNNGPWNYVGIAIPSVGSSAAAGAVNIDSFRYSPNGWLP